MDFKYTAITSQNKKKKGTISAQDRIEAIMKLKREMLLPLSIKEINKASRMDGKDEIELFERDIYKISVNKKKLLVILNQMAIMLRAGVGLSMIMDVLIDSESNRRIRKIFVEMRNDLFAGISLSSSMKKFAAFSEVTVNIVMSGEVDGRIDRAFDQLVTVTEKEISLSSKLKSAMMYPTFLLILTIVVVAILNAFVLPIYANLFEQLGAPLPAITVFVISVSEFLSKFWYIILGVIALTIFSYGFARRKYQGFCLKADELKLKTLFIGKLLKESYLSRFCRVLGSLSSAGVDIMTSLNISQSVVPNMFIKNSIMGLKDDVRVGISIHEAMSKRAFFPALMISMVRAGEESGYLSETLGRMALMYETQTDETAKRLTTLLEPAMTVIIALVVGTVIVSVVMPMFGMYTLIK